MEKEWSAIVELFQKGKKQKEIMKLLKIPQTRRNFVIRTIKRFNETGGVMDRARTGRPVSITTVKMRKVVRSRVWRNPQRSIRKMAKELKISRGSLQTIVKRDLGLSSFKKRKVHFLSDKIKTKRLSRSKVLHTRFAAQGLDRVLFSDKKLFTVEQAFNRQNDRILSKSTSTIPDEYRYVKRVQKPLSLMVWAGVSSVGRTPLVFVPAGVKINAATYKELILQSIVKDLGEMMFENQPFIFQQDGAPAHTANSTQEWLWTNIPDFISKVEWPPSSPDLNPLDFSVWSILESSACSKPITVLSL
ncbi:Transposase [Oopsacas minuta]|uniref:Transposase n=1 Tax=Oopsacas minuta TaxID=111878 RepID=A0AAV7JR66_9METZ|nr:Transposase [Oopsacas minuta]